MKPIIHYCSVVLMAILLIACSKATQDNFDKVEADMSREEVHSILGPPDEVNSTSFGKVSFTSETWKGRKHTISIQYANDKVKMRNISVNEKEAP